MISRMNKKQCITWIKSEEGIEDLHETIGHGIYAFMMDVLRNRVKAGHMVGQPILDSDLSIENIVVGYTRESAKPVLVTFWPRTTQWQQTSVLAAIDEGAESCSIQHHGQARHQRDWLIQQRYGIVNWLVLANAGLTKEQSDYLEGKE